MITRFNLTDKSWTLLSLCNTGFSIPNSMVVLLPTLAKLASLEIYCEKHPNIPPGRIPIVTIPSEHQSLLIKEGYVIVDTDNLDNKAQVIEEVENILKEGK